LVVYLEKQNNRQQDISATNLDIER
jgi:hypothetical protein